MLAAYQSNPDQFWRNKVAALYLVTTLSAKGSTARFGATQINSLVNLDEFFNSHVLPELKGANGEGLVSFCETMKWV